MKKTFVFVLVLFIFNSLVFSSSKIGIGLNYSYPKAFNMKVKNDVLLLCDCGQEAQKFYSLGVNLMYDLPYNFALISGVQYNEYEYTDYWYDGYGEYQSKRFTKLIEIPLKLQFTFYKYFFIEGGAIFDFEFDNAYNHSFINQSGIGLSGGAGIQYITNFGLGFKLLPYLSYHSIIPIYNEDYWLNYDSRYMYDEFGVNFGITYWFNPH